MTALGMSAAMLMVAAVPGSAEPQSHARLQWSERTKISSPGRAWQLMVSPALHSANNATRLVVTKRGASPQLVLTLRRRADAYWGGGDRLLIVNQPLADFYEILLYQLGPTGAATRLRGTPEVNSELHARLLRSLGARSTFAFFLPRFESWSGSHLVFTVGGTVVHGTEGPMIPYCYRVALDSRTAQIEALTPIDVSRGRDGACRVFP